MTKSEAKARDAIKRDVVAKMEARVKELEAQVAKMKAFERERWAKLPSGFIVSPEARK